MCYGIGVCVCVHGYMREVCVCSNYVSVCVETAQGALFGL